MDRLLRSIYRAEETQERARQAAARDHHRQRLLRHYTRLSAVIHSPHPLAILEPIRRYRLNILVSKLERNRLKHRHKAVGAVLRSLRQQHQRTKMQEVYELFDTHYQPKA